MSTLTSYFKLVRIVFALLAVSMLTGQADAIKLFNSTKLKRKHGVAVTLRISMLTASDPWTLQNLYFYPIAGSNNTMAPVPYNTPIRATGLLSGHSMWHARRSDKISMTLLIWSTLNPRVRVLDLQDKHKQDELPPEERWSGIVSALIPPEDLIVGNEIYITLDCDIPGDPPRAILNVTGFSCNEMKGMAAGIMPPPWTSSTTDPNLSAKPATPESAKGTNQGKKTARPAVEFGPAPAGALVPNDKTAGSTQESPPTGS